MHTFNGVCILSCKKRKTSKTPLKNPPICGIIVMKGVTHHEKEYCSFICGIDYVESIANGNDATWNPQFHVAPSSILSCIPLLHLLPPGNDIFHVLLPKRYLCPVLRNSNVHELPAIPLCPVSKLYMDIRKQLNSLIRQLQQ